MARGTRCDAIRSYLSGKGGTATRAEMRRDLELNEDQFDGAAWTLIKQGHIRRVGRGAYELVPGGAPPREAVLEQRIWKAMSINPTWSVNDIALQSGTSPYYIYKRLRFYRAEGYVKTAGGRPLPQGSREKLWRMTMKGRRLQERPAPETFQPDPLIVKAVALNRLICTGLAQRFEEQEREALQLARDITEMLSSGRENAR